MQRNYKLILSIIALTVSSLFAFCQEKVEYKDVVLDGKPAKLNIATGEITLVNSIKKQKEDSVKNTEVTEQESEVADTETGSDFYIVKEGETLLKIANKFKTSLTALKRANNLETTLVDEGQWLRVKNLYRVDSSSKPYSNSSSKSSSTKVHIVETGQTLYSIAKTYKIPVDALKSHNGLTSNIIKVGQKLSITGNKPSQYLTDVIVWEVAKGDTLYSIARKNETTVNQIKELNGLTGNLIHVGQKLQLKQKTATTKK